MSLYFNGDLEDFLLSGQKEYKVKFNSFNQEFEYFLAFLEDDSIYTNKTYSPDYQNYLKYRFNIDIKTDQNTNDIKLWCFDVYDLPFQKKVNSRFFTSQFANKYNEYKSIKIYSPDELEEGFLYKEDLSVSGMGNYLFPKDKNKLLSILKQRPLLKEKFLDRQLDISSLVDEGAIYHYQNLVDEYFQYKGTLIGKDFKSEPWFLDYEDKVSSFVSESPSIQGPYSIDSFIYDEKLHFLSEVNNRKTMGYVAYKIKEKFFDDFKVFKSILIPSKKINDNNISYSTEIENVYLLSPRGNIFCYYVIVGDSLEEIKRKELELYSGLFN